MNIKGILEVAWIALLMLGILVPFIAGCTTLPKFQGEIHLQVENEEGEEEKEEEERSE